MSVMDRRAFLVRSAAVAGGLAIAGPLEAFRTRVAAAQPVASAGYGPLVDMGDLWLPEGFQYRMISRRGDEMTDVDPATGTQRLTPSRFDGMAAFTDPETDDTILIRNHENRSREEQLPARETRVEVPNPYDPAIRPQGGGQYCKGGVTKLVVRDRKVVSSTALLGGTIFNCAGGATPWGHVDHMRRGGGDSGATPLPYRMGTSSRSTPSHRPRGADADQGGRAFRPRGSRVAHGSAFTSPRTGASCRAARASTAIPRIQSQSEAGDLAAATGPLHALVVDGYPNLYNEHRLAGRTWTAAAVSWVTVPGPRSAGGPGQAAERRAVPGSGARGCDLRADGGLLAGGRARA